MPFSQERLRGSRTWSRMRPIPWISKSTTSPSCSGPRPSWLVPQAMRSPELRVMIVEANSTSSGTRCSMSSVLLRMLPVIGDAAEDLARPRQGRPQPHRIERSRLALGSELFQRRAQPVEIVDDALHRQLRRVAPGDRAGDIDDAALGQQPGHWVTGLTETLKKHQLHLFSLAHCHPDEGRDPRQPWIPAFAGMTR